MVKLLMEGISNDPCPIPFCILWWYVVNVLTIIYICFFLICVLYVILIYIYILNVRWAQIYAYVYIFLFSFIYTTYTHFLSYIHIWTTYVCVCVSYQLRWFLKMSPLTPSGNATAIAVAEVYHRQTGPSYQAANPPTCIQLQKCHHMARKHIMWEGEGITVMN